MKLPVLRWVLYDRIHTVQHTISPKSKVQVPPKPPSLIPNPIPQDTLLLLHKPPLPTTHSLRHAHLRNPSPVPS